MIDNILNFFGLARLSDLEWERKMAGHARKQEIIARNRLADLESSVRGAIIALRGKP